MSKPLTTRQTVKINAALAIIHKTGGDVASVTTRAASYLAKSGDARRSYELALNDFASANPDTGNAIARVTQLIAASDDGTVQQYGAALDAYNASGDEAGLNALAPTLEADMASLDTMTDAGEAPPSAPDGPAPIRQQFPAAAAQNAPQPAPVSAQGSYRFAAGKEAVAPGTYRSVAGKPVSVPGAVSWSAPLTGAALARAVGVPLSYTGPAIEA
ncbi:hypothetical protein [Polymorphobacter megasporae]|uniref:hypothetical protein n=1 Tax=Glacieibacterium megasporae TaxID=2835787 RepID=UPI001C1E02E6|nr:hypothetical protein [Polymorphobacter megasporae]UAJ09249.1 hypothetical protein KTC28_13035 [Polymorphobacter megasporae]